MSRDNYTFEQLSKYIKHVMEKGFTPKIIVLPQPLDGNKIIVSGVTYVIFSSERRICNFQGLDVYVNSRKDCNSIFLLDESYEVLNDIYDEELGTSCSIFTEDDIKNDIKENKAKIYFRLSTISHKLRQIEDLLAEINELVKE